MPPIADLPNFSNEIAGLEQTRSLTKLFKIHAFATAVMHHLLDGEEGIVLDAMRHVLHDGGRTSAASVEFFRAFIDAEDTTERLRLARTVQRVTGEAMTVILESVADEIETDTLPPMRPSA